MNRAKIFFGIHNLKLELCFFLLFNRNKFVRGIARSVVFEMGIYPERVNKLNCVAFVLVYFIAGNTRTVVYSSIKIYTSNISLYI